MKAYNPNHPIVQATYDHWHKIVAILMHKLHVDSVVITVEDMKSYEQRFPKGGAVAIKEDVVGLHLWLVSDDEARRLAKKEGGLPV